MDNDYPLGKSPLGTGGQMNNYALGVRHTSE
jgi:hypothetical protein